MAGAPHPSATVYLATNQIDGKRYVGVTKKSVRARFTAHVSVARRNPKTYFHRAIAKHGAANFVVEPIFSVLRIEDAVACEREIIQQLQPEYNQTNGGEFTVGRRASRETVAKIAAGNRGQKRSDATRALQSSIALKRFADPSARAAVIARLDAARPLVDREKQRAAAGASSRARVWSDESRAKLSASCMGRRYSQDIIDRMAAKKNKAVRDVGTGRVYASVSEAAAATGLSISGVSRVCRGERKRANGLRFEFVST